MPPPLFRPDLSEADCRDYAKLVNEGLFDACRDHPGVLRPLAYLPVEAPEVAAGIAASLDRRWAGVVMGTEANDISYASERLDPLWRTLSERKLPLFIHPGSTPDKRLDPFYLTNLLGNPVETTIAASHLVFAGVMQRLTAAQRPDVIQRAGWRRSNLQWCSRLRRGSRNVRAAYAGFAAFATRRYVGARAGEVRGRVVLEGADTPGAHGRSPHVASQ